MNFLQKHYRAAFIDVPTFMSTCEAPEGQVLDHKAECLEVSMQSDDASQLRRVVQLAIAKSKDVPVVIITKTPERVREICTLRLTWRVAGNVARSRYCDTRRRKGELTGNTNFDLN